eukprot:gene3301-5742_t
MHEQEQVETIKVLCYNLEKRELVSKMLLKYIPDIALFQEWVLAFNQESINLSWSMKYTQSFEKKKKPCGTSIYSLKEPQSVVHHLSEHSEFVIGVQKSSCAVKIDDIWFISIHAYNGFPFKSVDKLQNHIESTLKSLGSENKHPIVFAGDFNTWTDVHLDAIKSTCEKFGLSHNFAIPYDEKKTLDHCFSRGVNVKLLKSDHDDSDHPFFLFEVKKK